jgi:hypothetical protein
MVKGEVVPVHAMYVYGTQASWAPLMVWTFWTIKQSTARASETLHHPVCHFNETIIFIRKPKKSW